ncbi:MAG: hypothetical protein ACI4LP_10825 [Anaerovoracaceae bacterium]
MNIELRKAFKQIIATGMAAALVLTAVMPVTADYAQAEQGRRDYYSCTENGQDGDGIHAGDTIRGGGDRIVNSEAEKGVGGFYIVDTKGNILAPNAADESGAGGAGTLYTGPAKGQKGAPEYYYSDGQAFYPEEFIDLGYQLVVKSAEDTEYWISSDPTSTALRKIVVEVQPIEYKVVYHCNAGKCEKLGCKGFHTDIVTMDKLQEGGAADYAKVWDAEGFKAYNMMFDEWNTSADGTGTALQQGEPVTAELLLTADVMDIVDIYAQWDDADMVKKVKSQKITGVKAVAGKGKVTIKWSNEAYADGYVIYRSTAKTKGFKKVITTSSSKSSFVNKKGIKAGKRYYYKVRGYVEINGKKIYTKYSSTVSAVVK